MPETTTVVPTAAPTWVMYKPDPTDPLFIEPTGIEGVWDESGSATKAAEDMLTQYAAQHLDWIVEVYRADGRLRAWASWDDGKPVSRLVGRCTGFTAAGREA